MLNTRSRRDVPVVDVDLYGQTALIDPQPVYRQIRDAGSVVWLPKHKVWAMGRFVDVRSALRDDATFRSGSGVRRTRSRIYSDARPYCPAMMNDIRPVVEY